VTGQDAAPVLGALAVVVAAGGLAVVAAGGWLRQLIGLVVAGTALIAAITAYRIDAGGPPLAKALNASSAFVGRVPESVDGGPWRVATVVLFAVAAGLGIVVLCVSRGWPRMGRRYANPAQARTVGQSDDADSTDLWKAFDDGRDPTQ
jgi:uncharacterized membrane protein (TIGR02234 family)